MMYAEENSYGKPSQCVIGGAGHFDIKFVETFPWQEWKRTFLFRPRKTLRGATVVGAAWKRERLCSRIDEEPDDTGFEFVWTVPVTQYAKSKKEIFLAKLQDEDYAVVVRET